MLLVQSGAFTALLQDDDPSPSMPVVVLCGWAGAHDKALAKYAELLASHGYSSVRSVQPTGNIFSPIERPRRQWALSLLLFLEQQRLTPRRTLVFYAFSNGGAFVVEQLQRLSEAGGRFGYLKQATLGFVFDSAPGYMHPHVYRKVLEAEAPPGLRRELMTLVASVSACVTPLVYGDRPRLFWDAMVRLDWGRPFLFLYSANDPLCDAIKLEELLAAKRASGQRVTSVRWEESEHCGHLKHHREEYAAALLSFLVGLHGGAAGQQGAGPRQPRGAGLAGMHSGLVAML